MRMSCDDSRDDAAWSECSAAEADIAMSDTVAISVPRHCHHHGGVDTLSRSLGARDARYYLCDACVADRAYSDGGAR